MTSTLSGLKKIIETEVIKYQLRAVKDYLRKKTTKVMRFIWFIAFCVVRLQFSFSGAEVSILFCLYCVWAIQNFVAKKRSIIY